MHTIMVVAGGLVLVARLLGVSMAIAAFWFIPVWLLCAAINMWVGVRHAGYTVLQEFPIFLVIFAIPALAALLLARRWGG